MTDFSVYETRLKELRNEMTARINALGNDIHHREEAVEKDFAEQVTQGENDDVLNALDEEARVTVRQINNALLKISEGTYGVCARCGKPIDARRLEVVPYTTLCIECAE